MYMFEDKQKKIESYLAIYSPFRTFVIGLTCRIYSLVLSLRAPEKLSSSSKSRIFLHNAHHAVLPVPPMLYRKSRKQYMNVHVH